MKHSSCLKLFLFVLLTSTIPSGAQSIDPDPRTFFPVTSGNRWEFQAVGIPGDTFTFAIKSDSVDDVGNHWLSTTDGRYLIDTANYVWNYHGTYDPTRAYLWYKLGADSGESWVVVRYNDSVTAIYATVIRIIPARIFGQETVVKVIDYIARSDDPNDPDTTWIGTRHLAAGFGWVRWDIEPSPIYIIAGALIDGRSWGNISSVKDIGKTASIIVQAQPNPCRDRLAITWHTNTPGSAIVRLYDALGQVQAVLMDNRPTHSGRETIYADLSGYPAGVYYCRVETSDGTVVVPVLKQ